MYDSYGALNNDGIAYYTERAKGGFGAVFLGVAMVDNLVDNYPPTLVENPLYAPGRYKKMASMLVERCGAYGTKVFGEVGMGGGRNSRRAFAPSAVETFNFPNERNRGDYGGSDPQEGVHDQGCCSDEGQRFRRCGSARSPGATCWTIFLCLSRTTEKMSTADAWKTGFA